MMGGLGMGFGMLLVLGLPLVLLIGGVAVAAGLFTSKRTPQPAVQRNPRQILDIRLARGEISREEHDVLLKILETER